MLTSLHPQVHAAHMAEVKKAALAQHHAENVAQEDSAHEQVDVSDEVTPPSPPSCHVFDISPLCCAYVMCVSGASVLSWTVRRKDARGVWAGRLRHAPLDACATPREAKVHGTRAQRQRVLPQAQRQHLPRPQRPGLQVRILQRALFWLLYESYMLFEQHAPPCMTRSLCCRMPACSKIEYDLDSMPRTSVVIVFYNEAWSTLMRSVHSVLNRSFA